MMQKWWTAALACGVSVSVAQAAVPQQLRAVVDGARAYPELPNYSAARAYAGKLQGHDLLARRAERQALMAQAGKPYGNASHFDAKLGVPTFVWAGQDSLPAAVGALKSKDMAEARGRDFLLRQAQLLGISAATVKSAKLSNVHDTGRGPVIARFTQRVNGVEVFNSQLNVMMTRAGRLVATSGSFTPDLDLMAVSSDFGSASSAVAKAFADMGGKVSGAFSAGRQYGGFTEFVAPAAAGKLALQQNPRAKAVYFPKGDSLVPAYYVELSAADARARAQRDYSYVVASSGEVLFRKNLTENEAFTYRVWADADAVGQPYDVPIGNGYAPFVTDTLPTSGVPSNLVSLESSALISTGDPWLPSGATVTTGNNVDAYLDIDPYKGQFATVIGFDGPTDGYQEALGDLRPYVSSASTFDYVQTPYADPATTDARLAAGTTLFYINNWQHDFWYDRGFDEAAGNAQTDNFDRGGVAGDPIHAEGQDAGGRNNANMRTPADGSSPRMQMYLFDGPLKGEVTVSSADEPLEFTIAEWDADSFSLSGQAVVALDDNTSGSTTDACDTLTNASALAGKIAVIDRGTCNFEVKAQQVEAAGAVGAIIVNNVEGSPITMAESDDASVVATIPSVMITLEDGSALKTAIGSGAVTASLTREFSYDLDGTVDAGVISHEFFHYVSNRLVNNASGLTNTQGRGMGEGWSDVNALLLEVRPEDKEVGGNDAYQGVYPMGYYVIPDLYFGIRRAPYSTDFAYNPLTFQHIQLGVPLPDTASYSYGADGSYNNEVHSVGEIWTLMLWEGYANLLNDSRYTFEEARTRMQDYIIAGLKMTPVAPTMVEAKDAILAAAQATDYLDFIALSKGFAKRGIGVGAVAPDRDSTDLIPVTESYVVAENTAPTADAGTDQTVDETTDGEPTVVTLSGSGADVDSPDGLTYGWTQVSGPSVTLGDATAAATTFAAPDVTEDSTLVFELTVTDPVGATATDTVSVTVKFVNQLPTADAGADVSVSEGAAVTLSGTASDPDGDEGLSYAWTQTSGTTATLSDADTLTPSFTAPSVSADDTLEFTLTVTDSSGATATDMVSVTVSAVSEPPNENQAPTADAGADVSVSEGAAVTLSGTASDPDGDEGLSYAWTQTSGTTATLSDADTLTPSFTAPSVSADDTLEFTLTVTDSAGATATDTVSVNVADVPDGDDTPDDDDDDDGGSGSFGWLTLGGLLLPALMRRRRKH